MAITSNLFAWGQIGHRIVGQIGDTYITPAARQAVKEILGTESLAIASTWADAFGRIDSDYRHTAPWHYINPTEGMSYEEFVLELSQDTTVNAFTKLNYLKDQLKTRQGTIEHQRFCLRMLIHILGDIHQPMHVSRKADLGGNLIPVVWQDESTNLHSVWDTYLIDHQKLSYTEYANSINFPTPEQLTLWQEQPMVDWFYESYELSTRIYAGITKPDQVLSYRYNYDYIETLNHRLLQAGVRLAGMLNEIFE